MLFNEDRARKILRENGVDAVIATSKENVAYITGHNNPTHLLMKNALICAIYSPGSNPVASAIIPTLEVDTFLHDRSWVDDIYLVGLFSRSQNHGHPMDDIGQAGSRMMEKARSVSSALEALRHAIESRGLQKARIALDESGLSFHDWAAIKELFPQADIIPGNVLMWTIRIIKTPEEIARLRRSSQIAERAVAAALAELQPGMTELALCAAYNSHVARMGALPSFAMFGAGTGAAQPHLTSFARRIEKGDLIRWDIGCTYRMYHSDTARAVVFGEPQAHQTRVWNLLAEGVEAAIALMKPGANPADLHRAAIAPLAGSGLENFQRFHCGHGIGISIYDPPIITQTDSSKSVFRVPVAEGGLEPGMVLNIEVGYYQQGFQGFLCEDTMVVTENGCERLTVASKSLSLEDYLAG